MARNDELLERAPARHQSRSFAETAMEPLARLRNEVDRLFGDDPGRWPSMRSFRPAGLLVPAVEMTETKKAFKLSFEVPGMDAADIEMHVHDNAIFIFGEKSAATTTRRLIPISNAPIARSSVASSFRPPQTKRASRPRSGTAFSRSRCRRSRRPRPGGNASISRRLSCR